MKGPLIFLTIWILGVAAMVYIHKDPVPVEADAPEFRLLARCNGEILKANEEDELPEGCEWVASVLKD